MVNRQRSLLTKGISQKKPRKLKDQQRMATFGGEFEGSFVAVLENAHYGTSRA